jgi:NCS1 family nucleobase:cation symporter-1
MAANVVSPANDFSNLSPRKISYVTGGIITAVIGIVMMPWKLYSDAAAYIFTWLIGYSSLMGALGGILIADYCARASGCCSMICIGRRAPTLQRR